MYIFNILYIQKQKIVIINFSAESVMFKCLKSFFKNFALRSDMFAAPATLRISGQTSYETIFGGMLSILLVVGFATVFYSSFIDVMNKVVISHSTDIDTNPYNSNKVNTLQFAVGIQGIDFRETQRYFELILQHVSRPLGGGSTKTTVELIPCSIEDWSSVGQYFEKLFQVNDMSQMLCPINPESISIQGFGGSDVWQILQFKVERCRNQSGLPWTCHSPPDIDSFIDSYLLENDFFDVKIYMTNTIFTPNREVYVVKDLQTEIFLSFGKTSGSRGTIKIADYNVTTDQSIWPVQSEITETGHYISDFQTHTVELFSNHYVKVVIKKDQTVYIIERTHGKLDQMLSYVGGLFALLFSFLVFFFASYNEYTYEVAVAENAFTLDESGKKVKQKSFHFFTFLKYALYDWMTTFGCKVSWKEMEDLHHAREQAVEQLDVRLIIKKLDRLQTINQILLSERNMICVQLACPPTLQKVKRMRKITQYYDKIIKYQNIKPSTAIVPLDAKIDFQLNDQSVISDPEFTEDENPSDFDSQDQEVQMKIVETYEKLCENKDQNKYSSQILENIPLFMKKRLEKIKKHSKKPSSRHPLQMMSMNSTVSNLPALEYQRKNKIQLIVKQLG